MVAGPTELGIIADASSDPELVALRSDFSGRTQ